MSRERCMSLDRAKRQQLNVLQSGGYWPERSPHRSPPKPVSPQYSPSTPEILRNSFPGGISSYSLDEFDLCPTPQRLPRPLELQQEHALEHQRLGSTPKVPQPEHLPDEYLEDFDQPSFYEPPANSSFDEVMCVLATPPSRRQASAARQLSPKALGSEVECPQETDHKVITKIASSPTLCPYKIPPLPDDPYDIPPHPKDPNDVVGFIQRSRAIHRLKALQEAEAAKKLPKGGVKKGVRGAVARKQPPLVVSKRPGGLGKIQISKGVPQPQKPKAVAKKKNDGPSSPERPPDYIAPEYAAAILRARQLAGLKTRNPKLLPKSKIAIPFQPRSAPSQAPPTRIPPPRTYASIVERAAAIRAVRAESVRQQEADVCSTATTEYVDCTDLQPQLMRPPHYREATAEKLKLQTAEEIAEAKKKRTEEAKKRRAAEAKKKRDAEEVIMEKEEHDEYLALERQMQAEEIAEAKKKRAAETYLALERQMQTEEISEAKKKRDTEAAIMEKEEYDAYLALERQMQEEEIAEPNNKCAAEAHFSPKELEALQEKISATYTQTKQLDSGQSAAEAIGEEYRKRIKELTTMLDDEMRVSPRVTSQPAQSSPIFPIPPVIRFFELMKRREAMTAVSSTEIGIEECMMPEYASDSKQFQDIADWNLANISGPSDICTSPLPTRVVAPITSPARVFHSSIAVDKPIPASLNEAFLDFGEDIDLGDITMPEDGFDGDMTLKELGLEDISSPEFDDLSISMLEGYDPDYPLDKSHDKDLEIIQEQQTSPGFLTTVVSAVVDKLRNIFGGTPRDVEEDEDEPSRCINLDSTLPNMFATTPSPGPTPPAQDPTVFEEPVTTPKYPKEYIAMVKKSQLIYKQKAMEAAEAAKASKGRKKPVVRGAIPKRAQPPGGRGKLGNQKKQEPPAKIYPPGEYSPRYAADVARARTLAGYKNRSAILNPERAAKIAAINAAKEAELAAEEALQPLERMRKRMARLNQKGSRLCPRPSIETLGTLEAIRANLPRPRSPKRKWEPATRRRADKNIDEQMRVYTKSPIRVFEQFKPMSPLNEESYNEEDLIRFTPLRAREGKLRLKHLKEQAERRDRDVFHRIPQTDSSPVEHLCTPEAAPINYSPIRLQSPSRPRSKELGKNAETTAQVDNRGEESIREEVTKSSTIENGDVHTTTRKVTTKTDEFGNVTCRIEEDTGLIGAEDAISDNIDAIEAPEFLHISDIGSPRDPSIPTPSQIIDRMRMQVQQKLNLVLPQISPDIENSAGQSLGLIEFPEDLPDELLYDIDIPELETTPQQLFSQPRERSPDTSLPYFWDEEKQPRTSQPSVSCPPTPVTETSAVQRYDHASPLPQRVSAEGPVVIPPFPKDPKDYVGMVKYARAIHKRKQQQEAESAARSPPPVAVKKKPVRVPISRRIVKKAGKPLLLKNKPKKIDTPKLGDDDVELPTEPPPLPSGYAEEVARARELAGYKNRTAALNPKVAAKLAAIKAAEEAALAEFEALPEYQQIRRRMEKVRRVLPQKPPIEEVLQPNASTMHQIPICKTSKELENHSAKPSPNLSLDEFLAYEEECIDEVPGKRPPSYNQAYYQELIEDFCPASKEFGREGEVDFGELAPSTPVDPRERLRSIKAYQELACPTQELDTRTETLASPSIEYSPIRLLTPTGEPRPVTPRDISPVQATTKNVLVDLETPKIDYRVKQFKDLQDMPFDELEYEGEPSFATASFEKPLTPPPQPSELISRIRKQVKERLRNDRPLQDQIASVSTFQFPEVSQEDLFELSDPSFAHTILGDTPTIQAQSPKISRARVPSPVRKPTITPTIQQEPEVNECPVNPVEEMYQPKYPKGYVEMIMKARAIHRLKQQQQAEMAAAPPPSEPTKKKGRITTTKPGGKVVMQKGLVRPPKIIKKKNKEALIEMDDELECPAEAPPLPSKYRADVALARQLAGYKNRTAALNPEVAAEEAAYASLPEHEKIKVRMERLRKKSGHRQRPQPSMEQLAFIQAMKETCTYETPTRDPSPSSIKSCIPQQRLSISPCRNRSEDTESPGLAQFLAHEEEEQAFMENPQELGDLVMLKAVDVQHQMKADAQRQQLATPRERYKRLLTQVQPAHKTPVPSTPVQTPDIHFSPICFASTPTTSKRAQRAEKSTTQITKTSEIVKGQLQQVTKFVTTTTNSSGNVTRQINESRHLNSKDTSAVEDELAGIEQPSYLDITPISPVDVPRPKDIIERIRRDVKNKPRPDVPTGQLIELRTPPRGLALPQNITEEELLEMSCPAQPESPMKSPMQSPRRSPVRSPDVSIPQLFVATPEPPTPPLPPVSPLRYRVHSPEAPIVIPPCPKDPTDYKAMVRMSRKIYELKLQKEAEAKAAAEAAAIEASKPKKKERVPISRWTAPPPRKAATRKKLVMKKRAPVEKKISPVRECPSEPPLLPEGYAEEVARARYLAGLRNPKVAARETAAEAALFAAPPPAPADYETLRSRMASMRKLGYMPKVQPSLQAAAYLNAVKGAMATRQSTAEVESAETRYKKILAARVHSPLPAPDERGMETTTLSDDVQYIPVVLGSPTADCIEDINFDILGLQDIGDLEEIQEPSFLDETGRYIPPSPQTPPPTPSAIIRRIREQVHEKLAAEKLDYPMFSETPTPLYFPEDLTEEELIQLSAPSFARTPQSQSPIQVFTPNISIPRYFEATPQAKLPTPMSRSTKRPETVTSDTVKEVHASASPPLMGIHPGLRVVTPEGPLVIPPHPKGRESIVDMIRRAQIIHKVEQAEAAKADAKVVNRPGVRVPISRRPGGPITRATKKSSRPVKPKEKPRKNDDPQLPEECPAEPPELPPEYVADVARARRLAGLKNTTALLNPPQDYGTIMARVAAIKMARGEIEPTAQEMIEAQNIIRRPERKEAEEQQQTPRPAIERYRALRSRVPSETPTTSRIPYSPIKTPVLDNLPSYKPVCLAPTPPFLQNLNLSDIGDISMPYDHTQNTGIDDISMPFDMDDGETDTCDICVSLSVISMTSTERCRAARRR